MNEAVVKGWCPGALRPMMSGDGLLVRLRLSGGVMSAALAQQIAALAREFGNGQINLSARGNLQLRGVSEARYPKLINALRKLDILDANAQAEAVRNILISPLAGLDKAAKMDVRPTAKALESLIETNETFWKLPGKFSFIVEDGGAFALTDTDCDIRLFAVEAGHFGLKLGQETGFFGIWPTSEVLEAVTKAVAIFVAARQMRPLRHMQDLILQLGVPELALRLNCTYTPFEAPKNAPLSAVLGQKADFLGLGVPFGLLSAAQLEKLADFANGSIRLTPWRALLVQAQTGASEAEAAGFIVSPEDSRLRLVACTGKPGCWQASVAAPQDALQLGGLTSQLVHVSGCAKGCAHPKAAAYTFVGCDGLYDLVENGRADATPSVTGVSPDALTSVLAARIAKAKMEEASVL